MHHCLNFLLFQHLQQQVPISQVPFDQAISRYCLTVALAQVVIDLYFITTRQQTPDRGTSDVTGPNYLKAIHGPLPHIRLMPTGGVNLQTAASFLRAGACALGIGGSLVEAKAVAEGKLDRIESLARQYVEIVRETRGEAEPS